MAVTVKDLLKLPCLREARVLGGGGGLGQTVSSISVLEYSYMNTLQNVLASTIDFYGNEIVITAFANARDNVETQLANMRQLYEAGEVGLILYYVGIILPEVDPKLMQLADELDFPLICMPENRYNLRYSEVICEVMESIFQDQLTDTWFQGEILERVSRLPSHQRSVDTVMRMLSDRVRASLVLTDAEGRVLNTIAWPRTMDIDQGIFPLLVTGEAVDTGPGVRVDSQPVQVRSGAAMQLFVLKQGEALKPEVLRQLAEVLQLSIQLWSKNHGQDILPDLVQAILQDDPVKMRRIAEVFNVNVASIHNMFILRPVRKAGEGPDTEARLYDILRMARADLCAVCQTVVGDVYDGHVVLFCDDPAQRGMLRYTAKTLVQNLLEVGMEVTLTSCCGQKDTTQVRAEYLVNAEAWHTACAIYPGERIFPLQTMQFAHRCAALLRKGEAALRVEMAILGSLEGEDRLSADELCDTLAVYLLDSGGSVTAAAERMFLHKNTVKYRLTRAKESLGFAVGSLPESMGLYTALALRRLLNR